MKINERNERETTKTKLVSGQRKDKKQGRRNNTEKKKEDLRPQKMEGNGPYWR